MAIPLLLKIFDKRGNTSTGERMNLMQDLLDWFGRDHIDCVLADCEFVSERGLKSLNDNHISYHIRLRNN